MNEMNKVNLFVVYKFAIKYDAISTIILLSLFSL